MKNKVVMYLRGHREQLQPGEETVQDQLNAVFAHINRQEMGRKIKAGIARKKDFLMYQDVKGRTKRYQYNVTKMRRPSVIKNRN